MSGQSSQPGTVIGIRKLRRQKARHRHSLVRQGIGANQWRIKRMTQRNQTLLRVADESVQPQGIDRVFQSFLTEVQHPAQELWRHRTLGRRQGSCHPAGILVSQ